MSLPDAAAQPDLPLMLDDTRRRFVEDLAQLFARYGLPLTFGRVFGLLLMSNDPVSLDDIAAQLGTSKSGASVAARDLERIGVARRIGTPGSRRVMYEANQNLEPIFEAQFARIRHQFAVLRQADTLLTPGRAKERMRDMLDLHQFWLQESDGILERWRQRRNSP